MPRIQIQLTDEQMEQMAPLLATLFDLNACSFADKAMIIGQPGVIGKALTGEMTFDVLSPATAKAVVQAAGFYKPIGGEGG